MSQADPRQEPAERLVREQLVRILASSSFDASTRSQDFLRYVVEETLEGNGGRISQAAIAIHAFGRSSDFDASIDPIVRIQAGRLRRSLERYYLIEGAEAPVVIDIPKGTYVPVFRMADPIDRGPSPRPHTGEEDPATGPYQPWPVVEIAPLADLTGDPAREYVARGMTTELAVELGCYQDLRVVPLACAPSTDARRSDARFRVQGTVQQGGSDLVVAVSLIDLRDGSQLWGERFGNDLADTGLLGFQHETAQGIAARIADEQGILQLTLARESRRNPPTRPTTHDAILRAYHADRVQTPEAFVEARTVLEAAVYAEPECGIATALLARLYAIQYAAGQPLEGRSLDETIEEASALGARAIRLEPLNQRARGTRGFLHLMQGDLLAGRRDADIALRLNPSSLCFVDALGYMLTLLGDWERGTSLIRKAIRLNPCHRNSVHYALWLDAFRRASYEEALQEAMQCLVSADLWAPLTRAATLGKLGRTAEAQAAARSLLEHRPDFPERGRWLITRYVKFAEIVDRLVEGLARAGVELADPQTAR